MIRSMSYSKSAWQSNEELLEHAGKALKGVEFDSMVGTGLSGAMVVPILAKGMDKDWAIVRKPGIESHGGSFQGIIKGKWIFVDDFISTGSTLKRVRKVIEDWDPFRGDEDNTVKFIGSYTYNGAGEWKPSLRTIMAMNNKL